MKRWQLWVRIAGVRAAVLLWTGDTPAETYEGRTYDQALGVALRRAADAVLRDALETNDPAERCRVVFVRHGPGEYQED